MKRKYVLDDQVELVDLRIVHDLKEAQHVRVVELLHNGDLPLHVVQVRRALAEALLLQHRLVHDLYSVELLVAAVFGEPYFGVPERKGEVGE